MSSRTLIRQLAYFYNHTARYVDAIYGPLETFVYGAEKVISGFCDGDEETGANEAFLSQDNVHLERLAFRWIDQAQCAKELMNTSRAAFIQVLLFVGVSRFLDVFPTLRQTHPAKSADFRHAFALLAADQPYTCEHDQVLALCEERPDSELKIEWLGAYKKASVLIKHHVVLKANGDVECLAMPPPPSDLHECLGLRLPEELFSYLSMGILSPRSLGYLSHEEMLIPEPFAGGSSDLYARAERDLLQPIRKMILAKLSSNLHRYYLRSNVHMKSWSGATSVVFKPMIYVNETSALQKRRNSTSNTWRPVSNLIKSPKATLHD